MLLLHSFLAVFLLSFDFRMALLPAGLQKKIRNDETVILLGANIQMNAKLIRMFEFKIEDEPKVKQLQTYKLLIQELRNANSTLETLRYDRLALLIKSNQ